MMRPAGRAEQRGQRKERAHRATKLHPDVCSFNQATPLTSPCPLVILRASEGASGLIGDLGLSPAVLASFLVRASHPGWADASHAQPDPPAASTAEATPPADHQGEPL